jgi:Flp pilus assembly protein protease CpaA
VIPGALPLALGLAVAVAYDLTQRRIPNWLSAGLLLAGVLSGLLTAGLAGAGASLAGAVCGLGLFLIPFSLRWMGGGDVKLLAAIGAHVGPWQVPWVALLAAVGGGVWAIGILLRAPALRREVGAGLASGLLLGRMPETPLRPRAQRVPLAVPLALATLGLIAFHGIHG